MLVEFLQNLVFAGEVVFQHRPISSPGEHGDATALLARAYADYRLEVAGPLIDFDAVSALAAGELVREACWFLVNQDEPPEELEKRLVMPAPPSSPAQHLSADVVLRFLPQVHRRSRAVSPADLLPALLANTLRQWPLTGVLADVEEGPTTALDFGGHPGLLLLYAERLAQNGKQAWIPQGRAREYVDMVAGGPAKKGEGDEGERHR